MKELIRPDVITKNMIQYCYTCPEAHKCDTEEKCITCWEEKGLLKKEDLEEQLTTAQLLTLYAE
ncbi:hypothetical protein I6N90_07155 [Paenibacillus sp. GSMTC-2017]|uniref:hypothetical protein n=1 Tax=Paenibacillus sp. GSMTC-2017 TaxID=2794350 RepID=UPI0018D7E7E6|nr:hypothetical protein [Paenibacillus sp. GSMTC-2017]MBH5317578.1 hypothetical protein [Paenibacillus sp. GSMTC-2017]